MVDETIDRARWLAMHVMPWEIESRGWLRRVAPPGLEADDVIQEAYAILASLADVSRIVNPRAYFYQIIKSLISEYLRRASVANGGIEGEGGHRTGAARGPDSGANTVGPARAGKTVSRHRPPAGAEPHHIHHAQDRQSAAEGHCGKAAGQ